MQTQSSDEKAVCLFVRLSVGQTRDCDKTEEISVQIFTPYERSFSLVFWEEEFLVGGGRPLLPEILCQTDRVGAKSPIFDLFSLVATQP